MSVASWRVITVTSFWLTLAPNEKPPLAATTGAAAGLAEPLSLASVVTIRPFAISFWRACSSLTASILPEVCAPVRSMAVYLYSGMGVCGVL